MKQHTHLWLCLHNTENYLIREDILTIVSYFQIDTTYLPIPSNLSYILFPNTTQNTTWLEQTSLQLYPISKQTLPTSKYHYIYHILCFLFLSTHCRDLIIFPRSIITPDYSIKLKLTTYRHQNHEYMRPRIILEPQTSLPFSLLLATGKTSRGPRN